MLKLPTIIVSVNRYKVRVKENTMQQVETPRDFERGDLKRIQELTRKRGLNGGEGYSYHTVRAVLTQGTRKNEAIEKLAEEYLQTMDNL